MTVLCACSCNTELTETDSRGRLRKYIVGHNGRAVVRSPEVRARMAKAKRLQWESQFPNGLRICNECKKERTLDEFFTKRGQRVPRCSECQPRWNSIEWIKRTYGVNEQEAVRLYDQSVCEICGGIATHVDHDHITGEIRGKLCSKCNTTLGNMDDDPDRLMAAAAYLLKTKDVLTNELQVGS